MFKTVVTCSISRDDGEKKTQMLNSPLVSVMRIKCSFLHILHLHLAIP